MKLTKQNQTQLAQLTAVLDRLGIVYMKADVTARDEKEKREVLTTVIMLGGVFNKASGDYLFACPVSNPPRNGTA
jgi:hypothetical protein